MNDKRSILRVVTILTLQRMQSLEKKIAVNVPLINQRVHTITRYFINTLNFGSISFQNTKIVSSGVLVPRRR